MRYLIFYIAMAVMTGCSVKQQIDEAKTFARCDFRIHSVEDLKLSDIKISNVKKVSDLSFKKAVRLASVLTEKEIPLSFNLIIEAYNPNPKIAAMNRLEWSCLIDETEIATGALEERVEILPDQTSEVPIKVNSDLKNIFGKQNKDTFLNLVFNLIGKDRQPVHLKIKIKPTILIGSWTMEYPGYITVEKEFTSEDGKKIRKTIRKEIED